MAATYKSKKKQRTALRRSHRACAIAWNRVCRTAKRLLAGVDESKYEWLILNFGSPMRRELKGLKARLEGEHASFFSTRCSSYNQGLRGHIFDEINLIGI